MVSLLVIRKAKASSAFGCLTSWFLGVPGMEDGVPELVRERGGVKMRRPNLSKRPAGVVTVLPSGDEVFADKAWTWMLSLRSRVLLTDTSAFAAPWSC